MAIENGNYMKRAIVSTMMLMVMIIIAGCGDKSSNKAPEAVLMVLPGTATIYDNGTAGIENPTITFDGNSSSDDDEVVLYHFDYGNGESYDSQESSVDREYEMAGYYEVFLEVEDKKGKKDKDTEKLAINYEARRSGIVDSTTTSEQTETYSVSEYNPFNGTFFIYADDDSLGEGTDLTITFYNSTDYELYSHEWNNVQDDDEWSHELDKPFLDEWGHGDYSVKIEATRGASNYSIEMFIYYGE